MDWTANISHGELLRSCVDESLGVDPTRMGFLFLGTSGTEYRGHGYATIPWGLGILDLNPWMLGLLGRPESPGG